MYQAFRHHTPSSRRSKLPRAFYRISMFLGPCKQPFENRANDSSAAPLHESWLAGSLVRHRVLFRILFAEVARSAFLLHACMHALRCSSFHGAFRCTLFLGSCEMCRRCSWAHECFFSFVL